MPAAQSRRMPERALGLLLTSGGWWVGLGSKAAHRPRRQHVEGCGRRGGGRVYLWHYSRGASATYARNRAPAHVSLRRAQPAQPLHTRGVLPAQRAETAWVLVAGGQQGRCRGVGWGRWDGLMGHGIPTAGRLCAAPISSMGQQVALAQCSLNAQGNATMRGAHS